MQKQTINIEQLRQALILAKNTKYIEEDETSYQIFSNAEQAISVIDTNEIFELKNELFDLLQCESYSVRREAIATLCFSTRLHLEEFKDAAYELWLKDENSVVKCTALQAWTAFYIKTKNKDVLTKLYEILRNSSFSSNVRATAYFCLFKTIDAYKLGYDSSDFDKLLSCETTEEFNRTMNWDEMHRLMRQYAPEALKE